MGSFLRIDPGCRYQNTAYPDMILTLSRKFVLFVPLE